MSLKAGRVGVHPADVDPINGHLNPSAVDSYTKAQADAKFETLDAAAALQPKTLAVPIEMLSGSKLTVETALQGLNNDKQDKSDWGTAINVDISETALDGYGTLTLLQNPKAHLLLVKWAGTGTAPSAAIDVNNINISSYIDEIPVLQLTTDILNGNYLQVNSDNTVGVHLKTAAWSNAYMVVPTKPKTT